MYKIFVKFGFFFLFCLFLFPIPVQASASTTITGTPLVLANDTILLSGSKIVFWGITTLAEDQYCWQGNRTWACGEQSLLSLKHHIENQSITCEIKEDLGSGKFLGQCFRLKHEKPDDISAFLVRHGWAMDRAEQSGKHYAQEQEMARQKKRGMWVGRFQTPADWRDGIQSFLNCEDDGTAPENK